MTRVNFPLYSGLLLITILFLYFFSGVHEGPNKIEVPLQPPPSIFSLGGATYFVSPSVKHKYRYSDSRPISGPCTVIQVSNTEITPEHLTEAREALSKDDVWREEFLQHLIFQPQMPYQKVQVSGAAQQIIDKSHGRVMYANSPGTLDVPTGPYYCSAGQLYQVYRLYPDTADSFMSATIQSPDDPYLYNSLNVSAFTGEYPTSLTVAVPSRLYFTPTKELPLAGLRIAVKDTQDVRGVKTTGSSRSYARLYGPQEKSATGVQRLLEHGAVVIGKLKSTQFGESEWATRDWVDYHAPWNQRADGYQTPSASSSGSGVAAAAYDWLDLSTGTDCCGSVRAPAAINGVFGIRPSTGSIDNKGVIPFSKNCDTFGVFTREIEKLSAATSVLYNQKGEIPACFKKPKRILYLSEYWPVEDEASSAIFEKTIQRLEKAIGTKRTELSLGKLWAETNPVGTDLSINDFFKTTLVTATAPDQWAMLKKFNAEFESVFGHAPPLNPQLQWKMEWLPTQTVENQRKGEEEIQIFRTWFRKHVMQADENGCSETILVLPWTQGVPSYRDEYGPRPSWSGEGWFFYAISVYAGAPEVILPIGQTPYQSRITKRQEWLPVAIGIVGARGTDASFTSFINEIVEAAKLPKSVDVGRFAFKPNVDIPNGGNPKHQDLR